jgi:hypothetical protein
MPVTRGDRIGESRKLNRRSVQAQDFYALLVASVPDDFGRFRCVPAHVALKLYPRRDATPALVGRVRRLLAELEQPDETGDVLLRTWEVDGVRFAELTGWRPHGNRFHRTPEPPWSEHCHSGSCLGTAIARARDWGNSRLAETLSIQLKEIRDRSRTGRGTSVPSVPSTPSYEIPPQPPASGGGGAEAAEGATGTDHGRGDLDVLTTLARDLGLPHGRPERRAWRTALDGGSTVQSMGEALQAEAARRQGAAADLEQLSAAGTWIADGGGEDAIAAELASWLDEHQVPGELPYQAAARWAEARAAPAGVFGIVARIVTRLRKATTSA